MNSQDIYNGVTDIRDDLINGAKKPPKKQKPWLGAVAAVLVAAIIGGVLLRPASGYAIAQAEYPEMAPYPDENSSNFSEEYDAWRESLSAQRRDLGDISALQTFFARSSQTFLTDTEGKNRVYSPLNVYMALSMLAQITDGESREQILTLLGSSDMDALRKQANDLWNANYRDDGAQTTVLASSLWLDEDIKYNKKTMDILAQDFYASSFKGQMGSENFNKVLQDWINEQTGGLLEEQAGDLEFTPETILALATTVYFKAKWDFEFSKEDTQPQTFHTPSGDIETDFMHQQEGQTYFWGENFSAVGQDFAEVGSMWFLLPDEGTSPEDLLSDSEALDFLFTSDKYQWENHKLLLVNKSIPKFDVASQFDLGEGLQALGVTDVFDRDVSDFTPAINIKGIYLSKAEHAARVQIDEEGCTAAAYTVMAMEAGAADIPDDGVDFILDRPFVFCITGTSGLPLFVGIVNYPAGE